MAKRLVAVDIGNPYEMKHDDHLIHILRRIESTLLKAGAVPGRDYTFLDLLRSAQAHITTEALEMIGRGLSETDFGTSLADVVAKGLLYGYPEKGLAEAVMAGVATISKVIEQKHRQ
jgi:hypothetical protein